MARSHSFLCHGKQWYLTCKQCSWFRLHPPVSPVYDSEASAGLWNGHTAFILAPGPSLAQFPKDALKGKLTIALNSAFFWGEVRYLCFAETMWLSWLNEQRLDHLRHKKTAVHYPTTEERLRRQDLLCVGRTGVLWQKAAVLPFRRIYLMRHQEDYGLPIDGMVAPTLWNALAQTKHMGCERVVLVGVDLRRDKKPYADGLPHDAQAESDDLAKQRSGLKYATFEGMKILHCNPQVPEGTVPWTRITAGDGERLARNAPEVSYA